MYKYSTYYRVMNESGINVRDAAVILYIQVLAITATMVIPHDPDLGPTILENTR